MALTDRVHYFCRKCQRVHYTVSKYYVTHKKYDLDKAFGGKKNGQ
jgi:hypothetical protein